MNHDFQMALKKDGYSGNSPTKYNFTFTIDYQPKN
jgi:hypothetical protein